MLMLAEALGVFEICQAFIKEYKMSRFPTPFFILVLGGGGHPGMALGFWGSEIGVARVGACLDYPHDRSRLFSKRRLSFLLGNEAL